MENKIRESFDSLHMSEELSGKIEASLTRTRKKNRWVPALTAAAACAAFALVCVCTPVGAAAAQVVEQVRERIVESILGPGHAVTEQIEFPDGDVVEYGVNPDGTTYVAERSNLKFPSWLEAGEDALWFTANGERIDLTGQMNETEPFTYVYEENGITYHVAVGGSYDPLLREDIIAGYRTEAGLGWCAFMSRETEQGTEWITGNSHGHLDPEGNEYVWFTTAKEILGVPW